MNRNVFISGGLTNIPNPESIKAHYERLGRLCEEFGLEPYIPHQHTDPIAHPHVPARHVYEVDRHHVSTSGLVIAYAGVPSLGVGQEIEIAREHGVPVLLLCERGRPLSRMTRGSPSIIVEIRFEDFEHALDQVKAVLEKQPQTTSRSVEKRGRGL